MCLVVDRQAARHPLAPSIEAAFEAGADWLQLRDRASPLLEAGALLDWAESLAHAALRGAQRADRADRTGRARTRALFVVNRRLDIALALEARLTATQPDRNALEARVGAHLGFDAVGVRDARALLGEARPVGCSAHAPREVEAAARAGASYAQLAPIFDPFSKPASRPALGCAALAEASRHGIAVLAQGGLDATRCAEVRRAGAAGIAVTGAILLADDPGHATRALRGALDGA